MEEEEEAVKDGEKEGCGGGGRKRGRIICPHQDEHATTTRANTRHQRHFSLTTALVYFTFGIVDGCFHCQPLVTSEAHISISCKLILLSEACISLHRPPTNPHIHLIVNVQ